MNIGILSVLAVLCSGIRVRNTQTTGHKGLQFKVMFADKSTKDPEVVTIFSEKAALAKQDGSGGGAPLVPLVGGFRYYHGHPSGFRQPSVKAFIEKILTDLPANITERLNTCGPKVKGNQNLAMVGPHADEVWILMTMEKLESHEIKTLMGRYTDTSKVLLIGQPGPGDDEMVTDRLRHVYIPSASLEFVETRRYTPLDLVNRGHPESNSMKFLSMKDDQHVYAYQHRNCKPSREGFFDTMCKALTDNGDSCHALGRCHGGSGLAKREDVHDDREAVDKEGRLVRDENAIDRYTKYKFVEAFEENAGFGEGHGYISEKMMDPLLAGAVPVYAGGSEHHVEEVFNPEAILIADVNDLSKTANRISYLMRHPQEYEAMVKAPAVTEENMKKYFTWHPATWPKYGDQLRMQIINHILGLCELS